MEKNKSGVLIYPKSKLSFSSYLGRWKGSYPQKYFTSVEDDKCLLMHGYRSHTNIFYRSKFENWPNGHKLERILAYVVEVCGVIALKFSCDLVAYAHKNFDFKFLGCIPANAPS